MSSEQNLPTSDLRSAAQDYKRDAARKHKWGMGAIERVGRVEGTFRPIRPSDSNHTADRRLDKGVSTLQSTAKTACKHDILEGAAATSSDESSTSNSDFDDGTPSPPADAGVMYSFDAARSPTKGSQILNVALAKAVERFEDHETSKLVKDEYDVLNAEGETVVNPAKKSKNKTKADSTSAVRVPDADEDYEFV